MNNIETAVLELLPKIQEALESGIEYGGDLFIRFQKFAILTEVFGLVLAVPFLCLAIYMFNRLRGWDAGDDEGAQIGKFFAMMGVIGFAIVCMATIAGGTIDIIKVVYVPELYIIDYFK